MDAISTKDRFDAAVKVIQSLPKSGSFQPSYEMMLTFYAFYKQATNGPCTSSRPRMWDVVGRAKWDAWYRLGNMSSQEAMSSYVEELKKIIETMPHTENVEVFLEKLGYFYEMIDDAADGPMSQTMKENSPQHKMPLKTSSVTNGVGSQSASRTDSSPETSDTLHSGLSSNTVVEVRLNSRDVNMSAVVSNGRHSADGDTSDDFTAQSDVGRCSLSAVTHVTAVNPVARPPTPDADVSSDGEEFCDSVDMSSFHADAGDVPVINGCDDADVTDASVARGGDEVSQTQSRHTTRTSTAAASLAGEPGMAASSQVTVSSSQEPSAAAGGSSGGGGGPVSPASGTVEQIAVTLLRLQQDMNNVLVRLQGLETLTQQQLAATWSRSNSASSHALLHGASRWWRRLFASWNIPTVAFVIVWPFVVNFILRHLRRRQRLQH